jgi:hypothetical protein
MPPLSLPVALCNLGCGLVAIALAVPLWRRKIRMNGFYGVRFARSFESDELWYRINEHGGWRLILWSLPVIGCGALALFVTSEAWLIALAFAPGLYVIPCVESYVYARRL